MRPCDRIKPGDLIEWANTVTGQRVEHDQHVWSRPMERIVPCGGISLVIARMGDSVTWLSGQGLFFDDYPRRAPDYVIAPRVVA